MTIYPLLADDGRLRAFEVSNASLSPGRVKAILETVQGVRDARVASGWPSGNESRVTFTFDGASCEVWEPFGDNSRDWVGPLDADAVVDVDRLAEAFRQFVAPWPFEPAGRALVGTTARVGRWLTGLLRRRH